MNTLSVVPKPKRPCVLQSVVVGYRRLVRYPSFRDVFEIEPKADDPVTITIEQAAQLSGLSRRTLNRMIAAAGAEVAKAA